MDKRAFCARWTKEEKDWLRRVYSTKTVREIADILGTTMNAVRHQYVRLGLKRRSLKVVVDFEEVRALYIDQGLTVVETAKCLGVPCRQVRATLLNSGVEIPQGRFQKKCLVSNVRLEDLYLKQRLSTANIAQALGVARGTVVYNLRKAGVPIRSRGRVRGSQHFKRNADRDREICEQVARGVSQSHLSRQHGISRQRIFQIVEASKAARAS
jgi:DNA-binding CsgD family transcriptional regulator